MSSPLKEDFKTYICILSVLVSWLEILNAYLNPQRIVIRFKTIIIIDYL